MCDWTSGLARARLVRAGRRKGACGMLIGGGGTGEGGGVEGGGETINASTPGGPRVSEEVEWKARALQAEQQVEALREQVAALEGELAGEREAVDEAERQREIERQLREARAIDLETARLLTESAVAGMDEPDVARAVAELRKSKPFLFAPSVGAGTGVMAGHIAHGGKNELACAAQDARSSGDRRALLRYLRLKRGIG